MMALAAVHESGPGTKRIGVPITCLVLRSDAPIRMEASTKSLPSRDVHMYGEYRSVTGLPSDMAALRA
jgi:hypothetical protein